MRNFYKLSLGVLLAIAGTAYASATNPASQNTRADEEWEDYCYGFYCDFILSDIHDTSYQQLEVVFQRNTTDPNTYRIVEPYANWNNAAYAEYYTYVPENATPFVFHIVGDKQYMWFEKFNTGFVANIPDADLSGEVVCEMSAEGGIQALGLETLLSAYPDAFAYVLYDQYGTQIGMYKDFMMGGVANPTAIVYYGNRGAAVNTNETFFILMQVLEDEEGGVEGIVDDENAPEIYYNLNGVRVDNPENGIFIMKKGAKSIKVVK